MKKSIFKKLSICICAVLLTAFSSCSKNDGNDPSPSDGGHNAKFTVTVTDAPASAYISFAIVGLTSDPKESTVWKVNGVVQNNQNAVSLGRNEFSGNTKTYVIESVKPLQTITAGSQCLNVEDVPYKISFKAEVNGEVKTDVKDFVVTKTTDFTKNYTY